MFVPGRDARSRGGPRRNGRFRRELAGIERTLGAEARLVSMFAMFNELTRGERPSGPEPLPRRGRPGLLAWPPPQWAARAAALAAMAAVIVGGLLLSSRVRPGSPCLALTAAGAPAGVPTAGQAAADGVPSRSGATSSGREQLCSAYPAKK